MKNQWILEKNQKSKIDIFFKMILYAISENYLKMFESFYLFYFEDFKDFDKYYYVLVLIDLL
jgi:hypothetical protein